MFDFNSNIRYKKRFDFNRSLNRKLNEDFDFGDIDVDEGDTVAEKSPYAVLSAIIMNPETETKPVNYKAFTVPDEIWDRYKDKYKDYDLYGFLDKCLVAGAKFIFGGWREPGYANYANSWGDKSKVPAVLYLDTEKMRLSMFNEEELCLLCHIAYVRPLLIFAPSYWNRRNTPKSNTKFYPGYGGILTLIDWSQILTQQKYAEDVKPDTVKKAIDEMFETQAPNFIKHLSDDSKTLYEKIQFYKHLYANASETQGFSEDDVNRLAELLVYGKYNSDENFSWDAINPVLRTAAEQQICNKFKTLTREDMAKALETFGQMINDHVEPDNEHGDWDDPYITIHGNDDVFEDWTYENPEHFDDLKTAVFCYVMCKYPEDYYVLVSGDFDMSYEPDDWEVGYRGGWTADGGVDSIEIYGTPEPMIFDPGVSKEICDMFNTCFDPADFDGSGYE